MLGKTHRLGGVIAALGGYVALDATGNTIPDVNPMLQLAVVYPFAIYGSTWSDLDHHWGSVPSKDPVSWVFHKLLHITTKPRRALENAGQKGTLGFNLLGIGDARHRSWQTHSDLTFVGLCALLWYLCFSQWSVFAGPDLVIAKLILAGLILGTLAHIFLDAITPEGIWMVVPMFISRVLKMKGLPEKFGLVPNKHFFATGNGWENVVNKTMWLLSFVLLAYIVYLQLPWKIQFDF